MVRDDNRQDPYALRCKANGTQYPHWGQTGIHRGWTHRDWAQPLLQWQHVRWIFPITYLMLHEKSWAFNVELSSPSFHLITQRLRLLWALSYVFGGRHGHTKINIEGLKKKDRISNTRIWNTRFLCCSCDVVVWCECIRSRICGMVCYSSFCSLCKIAYRTSTHLPRQ